MKLGLAMVVKDEANRIGGCLSGIVDLFDQVVMLDTGSTDGTQEILRSKFGIQPVPYAAPEEKGHFLARARNEGMARLDTPWIICLDADERIPRADLEAFVRMGEETEVAGYFCPWHTHLPEGGTIEDYKLFLVRKGLRHEGLFHSNMQPDIRRRGERAEWHSGVRIDHYPEQAKAARKHVLYRERLNLAIEKEPHRPRYRWFLGYLLYRSGEYEPAEVQLAMAARLRSREFPVECLNSHMILAEMQARRGDGERAREWLEHGLAFHAEVRDDFEVRVNFRLEPWLSRATEACRSGRLEVIRAYEFPY
ncbi:MAG: glycosyltransferase [Planctomycetota bacterium]|jgi:glycosyltransferase involved in cell wall biosynthesis